MISREDNDGLSVNPLIIIFIFYEEEGAALK